MPPEGQQLSGMVNMPPEKIFDYSVRKIINGYIIRNVRSNFNGQGEEKVAYTFEEMIEILKEFFEEKK